jgi:hypothetical protein
MLHSTRQLLKAFPQWKTQKYMCKGTRDYVAGINEWRKNRGKDTYFLFNKKKYTQAMIKRHLREQKLDEEGLRALEVSAAGSKIFGSTFDFSLTQIAESAEMPKGTGVWHPRTGL